MEIKIINYITQNIPLAAFLATHKEVGIGKVFFSQHDNYAYIELFYAEQNKIQFDKYINEFANKIVVVDIDRYEKNKKFISGLIVKKRPRGN